MACLSEKLRQVEGVKEAANANDLTTNVIIEELLRTYMARQCAATCKLLCPRRHYPGAAAK